MELRVWLMDVQPELTDSTCIEILDGTRTLFRAQYMVRDQNGRFILDGDPCPTDGLHRNGDRCRYCEARFVRTAVHEFTTATPMPFSVAKHFVPSSAEGTPNQ
jgi:hypothetical protein